MKRNFQVMPGAEWLALLCKHIPDRYQHLVRYVGWYSNRARGERANKALPRAGVALPSPVEEPANELATRAKAAWARLIRKVYEVDPLECPESSADDPVCTVFVAGEAPALQLRAFRDGQRLILNHAVNAPCVFRRPLPRVGPGMPACH